MASEYDHNEILKNVYEQLRSNFEGGELIVRKDGEETTLGSLSVDRRHFDGESGAPDIILDVNNFELLGASFPSRFPLALVEIETTTDAAIIDLEHYVDRDGRSSPVLIISDNEFKIGRSFVTDGHKFSVTTIPHNRID
jgi:hypothetical protein